MPKDNKTKSHASKLREKERQLATIERDTTVLYVRIPRDLHDRIELEAQTRGWPHTIASVASEALARGLA